VSHFSRYKKEVVGRTDAEDPSVVAAAVAREDLKGCVRGRGVEALCMLLLLLLLWLLLSSGRLMCGSTSTESCNDVHMHAYL
jgi:hypothetical protein